FWTLCFRPWIRGAAQICDAERHARHSYAGA
ncbi:rplA family protein, partial [Pseudomonas syringae pv. actinidifoliorum]|nr:rplA family protein [Pseudomonas syringae pv. actinidifoliorum]